MLAEFRACPDFLWHLPQSSFGKIFEIINVANQGSISQNPIFSWLIFVYPSEGFWNWSSFTRYKSEFWCRVVCLLQNFGTKPVLLSLAQQCQWFFKSKTIFYFGYQENLFHRPKQRSVSGSTATTKRRNGLRASARSQNGRNKGGLNKNQGGPVSQKMQ